MYNFTFQNTTRLIFGKGSIASLSNEIPRNQKIMITFGGGSVKSNGVYKQVTNALKGFDYIEFWGIEPNPTVETLRKAVELGKQERVEFLLAVGGGSVIDGTKLIASSILSDRDPWDVVRKGADLSKVLPFASILTLPATGSEMNRGSVISNIEKKEKFAFYSNYPVFSILDPETTFSLPVYQVACGIADTFVHVLEQYLTSAGQSPLMDRWAEGILLTLKDIAPVIIKDHTDYDAMATFMLSATMALNGFISMGVSQDWATHMIGHELTALSGITHGHSLTIVLPGTMDIRREEKSDKILQYGERVWGITGNEKNEVIDRIISSTDEFFRSLGLKTRLSENNVGEETINEIVTRFKIRDVHFGENGLNDYSVTEKILHSRI
jgi:NADP-dependent alcohol dehydrogenase